MTTGSNLNTAEYIFDSTRKQAKQQTGERRDIYYNMPVLLRKTHYHVRCTGTAVRDTDSRRGEVRLRLRATTSDLRNQAQPH